MLDLHSGTAVAARILLFSPDGVPLNRECAAREDGRFACPRLASGRYRLDITGPVHAPTSAFLHLDADRSLLLRIPRLGVISGSVMTTVGAPQPAEVVAALASPSRRVAATTFSDDRGRFRLAGLPPGEYLVSAGGAVSSPLRVVSGEVHDGVRLEIAAGPPFSVLGKVTPAWRGGALLLCLVRRDLPAVIAARTLMDAQGAFAFPAVPPGDYTVLAAGPSHHNGGLAGVLGAEPVHGRTSVAVHGPHAGSVDVCLQPAGSLAVELSPGCAPRADVVLRSLENWGAPWQRAAAVSPDAPAVLDAVPPARFLLDVTDPLRQCYSTAPELLDLSGGIPSKLTVKMARGGIVEGRTRPGSTVYLWSPQSALTILIPAADGAFWSAPLPPGHYRIMPAGPGVPDPQQASPLQLHGGALTRVELPRD